MVFELDEVCCFTLSTDQDITSDVHWYIGQGYESLADRYNRNMIFVECI